MNTLSQENIELTPSIIQTVELGKFIQTLNSIAIESKNEKEMLSLATTALCKFTGWSLGHVFLKNSDLDDSFLKL